MPGCSAMTGNMKQLKQCADVTNSFFGAYQFSHKAIVIQIVRRVISSHDASAAIILAAMRRQSFS